MNNDSRSNLSDKSDQRVLIIGAGIVGLCIAHALLKRGHDVVLFDPAEPGSECSSGNAGAISSNSIAPLAMPGLAKNTASMLLDSKGPLHVPFRYWASAAPWLFRFAQSARPDRVAHIAQALHHLLKGSLQSHLNIAADIGFQHGIRQNGHLHLYPDAAYLKKDDAGWDIKRAYGLRAELVDKDRIRELEPAIGGNYSCGLYLPDEGSVADPYAYAKALTLHLRNRGVEFVRTRVNSLSRSGGKWRIGDGVQTWAGDKVVVSAGAWSAQIMSLIGVRVPLISQRGYHIQVAKPGVAISRIVVLADKKVFLNPVAGGLRIAGTVEIDSLSRPMNRSRAMLLKEHARGGLPGVTLDNESVWLGHRPCLPDSMPVLGEVPGQPGIFCAFGHGHLGLTGSANTASLIADVLSDIPAARTASLKTMAPFSITRFD